MTRGADLPVWRSMLYVPVNVRKYVEKAHARGADAVILDLEDSIAPGDKEAARALVGETAAIVSRGGADVLVRINRPLELSVRDIEAAVSPRVSALMLPKIEDAGHVRLLAELAETVERDKGMAPGTTRFVAMIETPAAFPRAWEIGAAHPRNVALILGVEDFTAATGSAPDPDVLLYPKQHVAFAARAAGLLALGIISSVANYRDLDAYRDAVVRSRRFGFQGSTCIHPDLVPILNEGFSPSDNEVARAERIVAAYERATAEGRGSIEVDGKMVDVPIVERARDVVVTARRIAARRAARAQ